MYMEEMKKRIPNAEDKYPIEIEIGLIDEKTKYLVGWPGNHTYFRKSGLGYVETRAEWAHMQGIMLRMLLTGKFRTRRWYCPNPRLASDEGRTKEERRMNEGRI